MEFFLGYQKLSCQSKLKPDTFYFGHIIGPGRLDQNRTIKGRPQDVVCRQVYFCNLFSELSSIAAFEHNVIQEHVKQDRT